MAWTPSSHRIDRGPGSRDERRHIPSFGSSETGGGGELGCNYETWNEAFVGFCFLFCNTSVVNELVPFVFNPVLPSPSVYSPRHVFRSCRNYPN